MTRGLCKRGQGPSASPRSPGSHRTRHGQPRELSRLSHPFEDAGMASISCDRRMRASGAQVDAIRASGQDQRHSDQQMVESRTDS